MKTFDPRRKRPRGWRRRLRELDAWTAEVSVPPTPREGPEYASAEFWFMAWPRPLPMPIRRRVVQHLIDIHDRWQAALAGSRTPYYLGIWLFGNDLTESQVVAAWGDRALEYRSRHDPSERSAPPPLYQGRPYDLMRFEWSHPMWLERERLMDYAEEDQPWALKHADDVETKDGEVEVVWKREAWFAMLPTQRGGL